MAKKYKNKTGKIIGKDEVSRELAVRKEDLDRIRGMRKVVDPERGPENKKSPHS